METTTGRCYIGDGDKSAGGTAREFNGSEGEESRRKKQLTMGTATKVGPLLDDRMFASSLAATAATSRWHHRRYIMWGILALLVLILSAHQHWTALQVLSTLSSLPSPSSSTSSSDSNLWLPDVSRGASRHTALSDTTSNDDVKLLKVGEESAKVSGAPAMASHINAAMSNGRAKARQSRRNERDVATAVAVAVASPIKVNDTELSIQTEAAAVSSKTQTAEQQTQPDSPPSPTSPSSKPSWENSTVLPTWIKDYARWHQEQRSNLTIDNWDQHRYFVLRCFEVDGQCGGASDRLQSLPAKLRIAARYNRLLLIYWQRPARLEEFLVPPVDGIDWRVPDWLVEKFEPLFSPKALTSHSSFGHIENINRANDTLAETKVAFGSDSGASWYDGQRSDKTEATVLQVFFELWSRLLFVPSPPVQALIDAQMTALQLQPLQYDALHLRVLYLINEESGSLVENATNCALNSFENTDHTNVTMPLYVAGDSPTATNSSIHYARQYSHSAVTRTVAPDQPILHLDRGANFMSGRYRGPSTSDSNNSTSVAVHYYDTFVDLYVLSMARCIAYGRGSYGRWANLMSANSSCFMTYFDANRKAISFPPQCLVPPTNSTTSSQGAPKSTLATK